jgi:SAM-dependent methyltransferase
VRFDRAVEYYDRTRALPDDVVARQRELLHAELRDRGTVLEIGVGTGRIATTLDVPLVGLDLSRPMMEVLRSKSTAMPLIEGDATRLPFAAGTFGAAYAAHVFHLIPAWEDALAELVRVVGPGGVVLAVRGSGANDVERAMNRDLGVRNPPLGAHLIEDIDDGARRLGLGVRALETITWTRPVQLSEIADNVEQGIWSGMWDLTPEQRRVEGARVRQWSVERYGAVDAVVDATSSFAWHAYDVP